MRGDGMSSGPPTFHAVARLSEKPPRLHFPRQIAASKIAYRDDLPNGLGLPYVQRHDTPLLAASNRSPVINNSRADNYDCPQAEMLPMARANEALPRFCRSDP